MMTTIKNTSTRSSWYPYVPTCKMVPVHVLLAVEEGWVELSDINPQKPADRAWVAKVMVRALGYGEEAEKKMSKSLPFRDALQSRLSTGDTLLRQSTWNFLKDMVIDLPAQQACNQSRASYHIGPVRCGRAFRRDAVSCNRGVKQVRIKQFNYNKAFFWERAYLQDFQRCPYCPWQIYYKCKRHKSRRHSSDTD